jgi:hypothetical protein
VIQGDPLWTVADWTQLWVRVPVFEADLPRINEQEPAVLQLPGSRATIAAARVRAPQPTEPGRRTVDLYYEVNDPASQLRPGQAVQVALRVGSPAERLVVPKQAVIWEGSSAACVILRTGPTTFQRRAVQLGPVHRTDLVVESGLSERDELVTVGAESVYGEKSKDLIPVDND